MRIRPAEPQKQPDRPPKKPKMKPWLLTQHKYEQETQRLQPESSPTSRLRQLIMQSLQQLKRAKRWHKLLMLLPVQLLLPPELVSQHKKPHHEHQLPAMTLPWHLKLVKPLSKHATPHVQQTTPPSLSSMLMPQQDLHATPAELRQVLQATQMRRLPQHPRLQPPPEPETPQQPKPGQEQHVPAQQLLEHVRHLTKLMGLFPELPD